MSAAAGAELFDYDSARDRGSVLTEVRALLRYRGLLRMLIVKTVKSRYKRSAFGVVWTLLNPLINMAVLAVVFSTLFRGSVPNYAVYVLIGLTTWNFFSQSTSYAMGQFAWGGTLIKKVYVPPSVFAVACVGNGIVNIGLSLIPLLGIMLALRHPFYATWWFLPVALLVLSVFSLGVALFLSTLAVFFADVVDMYQLLLQAWFFLTPIIYPRTIFPDENVWMMKLNPMAYMIDLVRLPIYAGRLPDLQTFLLASGWALAALALGAWFFTAKADEFAYR
jgi:ABC-type polysaccharide/polyol phosphate export permease